MPLIPRDRDNLKPEDQATVNEILRQNKIPVIPIDPEKVIYGRVQPEPYILWSNEGLERNNIWTIRHLLTAYGIRRRDNSGDERSKKEMIEVIRKNPQYQLDELTPLHSRLVNGHLAPEKIYMDKDPPLPMPVHPPRRKRTRRNHHAVNVREIPVQEEDQEEPLIDNRVQNIEPQEQPEEPQVQPAPAPPRIELSGRIAPEEYQVDTPHNRKIIKTAGWENDIIKLANQVQNPNYVYPTTLKELKKIKTVLVHAERLMIAISAYWGTLSPVVKEESNLKLIIQGNMIDSVLPILQETLLNNMEGDKKERKEHMKWVKEDPIGREYMIRFKNALIEIVNILKSIPTDFLLKAIEFGIY